MKVSEIIEGIDIKDEDFEKKIKMRLYQFHIAEGKAWMERLWEKNPDLMKTLEEAGRLNESDNNPNENRKEGGKK